MTPDAGSRPARRVAAVGCLALWLACFLALCAVVEGLRRLARRAGSARVVGALALGAVLLGPTELAARRNCTSTAPAPGNNVSRSRHGRGYDNGIGLADRGTAPACGIGRPRRTGAFYGRRTITGSDTGRMWRSHISQNPMACTTISDSADTRMLYGRRTITGSDTGRMWRSHIYRPRTGS